MFSIPLHEVQALIPPEADVIAHRRSLPLFGDGLVEAIPDEVLIGLEDPDDTNGDGVSGRAHRVFDKANDQVRIGRFGWKAQQATLLAFGAEAYRDEMGITNALFPDEVCHGDCSRLKLIDPVSDPEDRPSLTTGLRGIDDFENFMKLLGPPPRGKITEEVRQGERLFYAAGCPACHLPSFKTGMNSARALSFKRFFPYGDFLLHDIGTGDGIVQGEALPEEIRTPPLWGVRTRAPYLHDGRASTLREAIETHGREALKSRLLFVRLPEQEKRALVAFLGSL